MPLCELFPNCAKLFKNLIGACAVVWYYFGMEYILENPIKQIFVNDPLLWLWLLLGVVGLVVLGVVLSWFFGKPVLKLYINGEVRSVIPKKRGEKIEIPVDLTEFEWFLDKGLTKKLEVGQTVKKRVVCLYTNSEHVKEGVK